MSKRNRIASSRSPRSFTRIERPWPWWYPWALVAIVIVAYHNCLNTPFVLDGRLMIENDKRLHQFWHLPNLVYATSRPLTRLTFGLNYAMSGLTVFSYHLTNVIIHAFSCLVLFALVGRTLRWSPRLGERYSSNAFQLSAAAALLWAVHPLQTQSVTYIYERAESLMGLFYLLTLYLTVRGIQRPERSVFWFSAAIAACVGGMASKAIMVTAPIMTLLFDRIFWADSWKEIWQKRRGLYLGLASSWLFLAYIASTPHESLGTAGSDIQGLTPWSYAYYQPRAIARYLRLAIWPDSLVLDYGRIHPRIGLAFWLPRLAVLSMVLATVWALWRKPVIGFLGLWFFLTLAPTSTFFPISDAIVEHRVYLALGAIAVGVVLGADRLGRRSPSLRALLPTCLALAVAGLTLATCERNKVYQDRVTLWKDVIKKRPNNPHAYEHLASVWLELGKIDKAVRNYEKALEIGKSSGWVPGRPGPAHVYLNLGTIFTQKKDYEQAAACFQEALKSRPAFAAAQRNLATVLMAQGRNAEALTVLKQAVKDHPSDPNLRFKLGLAYQKTDQLRLGIDAYRACLKLDPNQSRARNNLAILLAQRGHLQRAYYHFRMADQLSPGNPQILDNLSLIKDQLLERSPGEDYDPIVTGTVR